MQRLQRVLRDALGAQRSGARVVVRDEHTALVLDCGVFAHHQLDVIRDACPGVDITFHDTTGSTSGFMMKVVLPPSGNQLGTPQGLQLAVLFVACAAAMVVLLH